MVGDDDVAATHYQEAADHLSAVEDKYVEVSYRGEGGGLGGRRMSGSCCMEDLDGVVVENCSDQG